MAAVVSWPGARNSSGASGVVALTDSAATTCRGLDGASPIAAASPDAPSVPATIPAVAAAPEASRSPPPLPGGTPGAAAEVSAEREMVSLGAAVDGSAGRLAPAWSTGAGEVPARCTAASASPSPSAGYGSPTLSGGMAVVRWTTLPGPCSASGSDFGVEPSAARADGPSGVPPSGGCSADIRGFEMRRTGLRRWRPGESGLIGRHRSQLLSLGCLGRTYRCGPGRLVFGDNALSGIRSRIRSTQGGCEREVERLGFLCLVNDAHRSRSARRRGRFGVTTRSGLPLLRRSDRLAGSHGPTLRRLARWDSKDPRQRHLDSRAPLQPAPDRLRWAS